MPCNSVEELWGVLDPGSFNSSFLFQKAVLQRCLRKTKTFFQSLSYKVNKVKQSIQSEILIGSIRCPDPNLWKL